MKNIYFVILCLLALLLVTGCHTKNDDITNTDYSFDNYDDYVQWAGMHIWDVIVIVSNDSLDSSDLCIKPYIENPGDSFINAQTVMQMSINGLDIPLRVSSADGSYFFVEVDYAVAPTNIIIARKDNLHIILKKNGTVLINKTVVIPSDVNVQPPPRLTSISLLLSTGLQKPIRMS